VKGHFVPKLVDFGIAKDLSAPVTGSHHTVIGTPHFMSPEQARGSLSLDARTDQYSFAVMLYQLVTGAMPYDAESLLDLVRAIDGGQCIPPRSLNPGITPEFEAVLMRAMARDANARFASMRELGRALTPFASDRLRASFADDFSDLGPGMPSIRPGVPIPHVSESLPPSGGRVPTHPMSTTTTLDKLLRPSLRPGTDTTSGEISVRSYAPSPTPAEARTEHVTLEGSPKRPVRAIAAVVLLVAVMLGLAAAKFGSSPAEPASQNASIVPAAVPSAQAPPTPSVAASEPPAPNAVGGGNVAVAPQAPGSETPAPEAVGTTAPEPTPDAHRSPSVRRATPMETAMETPVHENPTPMHSLEIRLER
jgi:serine/threonine protein kinase